MSREASDESRKQAEAVSNFLVQAFRSPDPSEDGRQVKIVDVLDRASERVEKDLAGSPAIQGALLFALGDTYFGLGLLDRALSLLTKSATVRESSLGPDHPDTLASRNDAAVVYMFAGKHHEAINLHKTTLKLREAKLGNAHPDTLVSRNNLAEATWIAGRRREAIVMFEETLRLREAALGRDHPDTLTTLNDLGHAHLHARRADIAIALLETTLKPARGQAGS